ncbi:MAG: DUF11 domain-containing protein [Planctomycetes bacterium]|nr:DUF11 domain-containing protein [Planctomycetota bacterium]
MENVIRSRPKRSLVRRLIAPIASLALLSGGGWGAYHFYDSELTEGGQAVSAHSAPSAKDELKMLFASEDSPATEAKSVSSEQAPAPIKTPAKKTPVKLDRYALVQDEPANLPATPPELPPLVSEKTPVVPVAVGDRYAAATAMVVTQPSTEVAALKETETSETMPETDALETVDSEKNNLETKDIARGQEPSTNPLRPASSPTTPSDLDARAAFGAALSQAPKTSESNVPNNLATALEQARPLRPAQPQQAQLPPRQKNQPPTMANPRYQRQPTQPTTPPATAQSQRPAPPLDIQPPPQQPLPALGANPFGAVPPTPLQTSREPTTAPQMAPPQMANLGSVPQSPVSQGLAPQGLALQGLALQGLTPTPGLANHPGSGRPGESLLEGAQSPSITIQKLAPEEIQVGKRCTFAIRILNNSQRTAQNVQIRDEVPLGTELVGTAPRATVSGSEILWDLGTLSPGEERTVEMELLPKEEGELGSVAMVTLSAQASAKSRCTRPELALRLTSKPQVHVGQQHIVQIEISNPGSGKATGVMLLETIPTGVSHEAGPALEFEVGTLQPGENRRMELVLTAEQAGRINNVMTARADASLQVEASCEFEVIAPELKLSIEGPQRRFLERPATYRVSVDNPGTAAAKDVQLVTHLPRGMQFVSANNMGEYDSATHSVHWSLAELPASERGTVELVALPIESGTQTLQIATKARQGLEDRTDKQVLVEGLSALMFEVIDLEGLIEIGGETTYEIRVQNQGSKAATNVQIVAIMPAGIRATGGQGETRHVVQGERVVFAPLPQLAPKAETTFRIQAQGVRPGDQRVRVQLTADDLQQPITKEVSTRVYADE